VVRSIIRNATKGSALEPLLDKMGEDKNEDCLTDMPSSHTKMTGMSRSHIKNNEDYPNDMPGTNNVMH
jgi:hypothetical protein